MSTKFNLRGRLTITMHSARNLSVKELIGKMDPFAVATLSGSKDEKFKTKVAQDQHTTPVWEQSYIFNLEGKEELLHVNVWNEATLGDDHLGRLDLNLDGLDMSGKPAWYALKDKNNFSKQTGEIRISCVFDGTGLPSNSLAYRTDLARRNPAPVGSAAAASAPVATPQVIVAAPVAAAQMPTPIYSPPAQQQQQQPRVAYGNPPPQQQQQPHHHHQHQQPQYAQQQQQPNYQQQPVYQAPAQPMYQAAPAPVYASPPMQQQPMYAQQPMYQQAPVQPVFQQPVFQQPGISFQPAPVQPVYVQQQPQMVYQQQPQVVYQQQPIGYYANGQPRYQ